MCPPERPVGAVYFDQTAEFSDRIGVVGDAEIDTCLVPGREFSGGRHDTERGGLASAQVAPGEFSGFQRR